MYPPRHDLTTAIVRLSLVFMCLALLAYTPLGAKGAQTGSVDPQSQAVLDQVRSLLAPAEASDVQLAADGAHFIDLSGRAVAVLLSRSDDQGQVVSRCVTSVAEAEAFLSAPATELRDMAGLEGESSAVERIIAQRPEVDLTLTNIQIINSDSSGEGFNDPTPTTAVGGNTGTTVGQQRLHAFQYAASIWAANIQSTVPIEIDAAFDPLACSASSGVLGAAGPYEIAADFGALGNNPGPEYANTWYVIALANKRAGFDLRPGESDIQARFNSNLGTTGCLQSSRWYYGLDGNAPSGSIDLVTTLLHEFAHGLGFISLVGKEADNYGENYPYAPTPGYPQRDDVWNYFLFDNAIGKTFNTMSVAERSVAITRTNSLVWNGPLLRSAAVSYLRGAPVLTVTAPDSVAGAYQLSSASFGGQLSVTPIGANLAAASDADEDDSGTTFSTLDACSTLSNTAQISGRVALIDRGGCDFTVKASNAQAAGAKAVIIVNNQSSGLPSIGGSSASVTIPVVGISQSDGNKLRAALTQGVSVLLGTDPTKLSGTDSSGRLKLYAPAVVSAGSSVSHFDTSATPNLLMEPFINSDLDQSLDLTIPLMREIGWFSDINYNGVPDNAETDLGVAQQVLPAGVRHAGESVTIKIQVTNTGQLSTSTAHLRDLFAARLANVSWTASYAGGATGPAAGSGNLDLQLKLPMNGTASFQVVAQVSGSSPAPIYNTATVSIDGIELDINAKNNTSLLVIPTAESTLNMPLLHR